MDRYTVALPNGRSLTLSASRLRHIARGLGDQLGETTSSQQEELIVAALRALPESQRADALGVILRRFGDKQDIETVAQQCGLTPWRVWQLEESFLKALAEARAAQPRTISAQLA